MGTTMKEAEVKLKRAIQLRRSRIKIKFTRLLL
jgi:hypothetical protein